MAGYLDKGWVCLRDIKKDTYYVYALYDLNGLPFYIGKGKNYRVNNHVKPSCLTRHSHKNHKIKKIIKTQGYLKREILMYLDSEESAYEYEKFLISCYGLACNGGTLTNVCESHEQIPDIAISEHKKAAKVVRNERVPDSEVLRVYKKRVEEFIAIPHLAEEIGLAPRTLHAIFNGELRKDLNLSHPKDIPDLRNGMSRSLVEVVWKDNESGASYVDLVNKYNIPKTTVMRICKRQSPYDKVEALSKVLKENSGEWTECQKT